MNDKILELTNQLIEELLNDDHYKQLLDLHHTIEGTKALQPLIDRFQSTKKAYESAKRYGKYHPDLKAYTKAYQEAKTHLFTHELIKAYKELEKQFQSKLDTIASTLALAVSKQVKYEHKYKLSHIGGNACSTEKA